MLVTTTNVDPWPRAPNPAPALRNVYRRSEYFLFDSQSVIQTQPAFTSRSRRSAAMRCRLIGWSSRVHSTHQSDRSFSGDRSGCLCKDATANFRAKLKSNKLGSWKDCSPSRYTAINQKCSESSSRSLSPCPFHTRTHALPVFMQVIYFTT